MRRQTTRSTRSDTLFPYTTLFRSQIGLTDSAFTRIMGKVTQLGSTVQRHVRVGAKCSVAHGRYIQDTGLVWLLAASFSNRYPLVMIDRQIIDRKSIRLNSSH